MDALIIGGNLFVAYLFVINFHKTLNRFDIPQSVMRQVLVEKKDIHQVLTKAGLIWMGLALLASIVLVGLYAVFKSSFFIMWAVVIPTVTLFNYMGTAGATRTKYDEEQKKSSLKTAYGVKEWATGDDIHNRLRKGEPGDGVIGIHIGEGVHWNEKGHMLCVGGSGQGKGVNLVLPALLSEGLIAAGTSVVVLDPKGENAAVAAPHFKKNGYKVHVLNPFNIYEIADLGNSRWNPFDLIDPASNEATKLYDMLAMALHNRKGKGENSFFDNRCRQYISLYMNYANHVDQGNFDTVYKWLRLSGDDRAVLLSKMISDATFDESDTAKAILGRLTSDAAKTEENIYGTIEEAINILKDKNLRASLSDTDVELWTVADEPTAIFVCIPFEELGYYAAWVRMFFSSLLRMLTKYYNPERKVLVLLDEFPQLSYMDEVVRSLAVLRGYNVTLWPIVQSLAQLKNTYEENWELFLSSAIVKHWLSNGADNTTAEYITKRMPQALKFIGNNADGSPKEVQTKLLEHYDVINFESMICELSGLDKPIKFKKVPYWDNPFSKDNASPNPFYS